jgi:hypothetical protein
MHMNMRKLIVMACVGLASAWALAGEEVEQADFNGDGVQDTLRVNCEGGSGFSGCRLTVTDGKTNRAYRSGYFSSFGSMLAAFPVPNIMAVEPGKGFLKAFEQGLKMPAAPVDGSLAWLLDAVTYGRQEHKTGPFAWRGHFVPRWQKGPMRIPQNHHVLVGGQRWDLLRKRLIDLDQATPDERAGILGSAQGWILYWAHNHEVAKSRTVTLSGGGKLQLTAHGVVYEEGGQHCWLWVSDASLAGPDKLRRPSMSRVEKSGDLVFVQVERGALGTALVVINARTGWFGSLDLERLSNASQGGPTRLSGWTVDQQQLTVRNRQELADGKEKPVAVRLKLSDLAERLQRR